MDSEDMMPQILAALIDFLLPVIVGIISAVVGVAKMRDFRRHTQDNSTLAKVLSASARDF